MKTIYQFTEVYYPLLGGVQSHINTLVNNLNDYNVEVISNAVPDSRMEKVEHNANVKIKYISPIDTRYYPRNNKLINKLFIPQRIFSDIIRNYNKKRYLKETKFDLLHVHGPAINMNFLGIDLRLNRLVFTRYSDFSYLKKPKVLTLHGLFSPDTNNNFVKRYEEFLIDQFDNIICVDKIIHSYVLKYLKDIRQIKNVWYIPNSIDTNNFKYAPFPKKDKLQVGFVGRIEEPHGTKLLLEFIQKMPLWVELHIVAAGSDNDVKEFKSNMDPNKVHFYSNIKYNDMPEFYQKIDVLLNPVIFEAITRVSLEAMACGRPVIMTNMGNRYPVIDGKTGYIIENNIEDVVGVLSRIYDNRDANKQLGITACKVIESEFSTEIIQDKIEKIYNSLITQV